MYVAWQSPRPTPCDKPCSPEEQQGCTKVYHLRHGNPRFGYQRSLSNVHPTVDTCLQEFAAGCLRGSLYPAFQPVVCLPQSQIGTLLYHIYYITWSKSIKTRQLNFEGRL